MKDAAIRPSYAELAHTCGPPSKTISQLAMLGSPSIHLLDLMLILRDWRYLHAGCDTLWGHFRQLHTKMIEHEKPYG